MLRRITRIMIKTNVVESHSVIASKFAASGNQPMSFIVKCRSAGDVSGRKNVSMIRRTDFLAACTRLSPSTVHWKW